MLKVKNVAVDIREKFEPPERLFPQSIISRVRVLHSA